MMMIIGMVMDGHLLLLVFEFLGEVVGLSLQSEGLTFIHGTGAKSGVVRVTLVHF